MTSIIRSIDQIPEKVYLNVSHKKKKNPEHNIRSKMGREISKTT
jgi:hypothetical protein